MVVLLSTTIISCSQAVGLVQRLTNVVGLTDKQKNEIVAELKRLVPTCPIKIKN